MKTKVLIIFLSLFFFHSTIGFAQSNKPAISKGASLISGTLSFSSRGGSLYGGKFTSLSASSKYHYFVIDRLGIGLNVSHGRVFLKDNDDFISWSIGPNASYFFDIDKKFVPFVGAGANLLFSKLDGSNNRIFQTNIGGGLAVFKGSFAILYEIGIDLDRFKTEGGTVIKGNTFYISAGAAVSLFPNKQD